MKFSSVRLYFKPDFSIGNPTTPLDSVIFPLDSTIATSPFVLKSADGLDPPDISVLVGQTLEVGGSNQGRRPQNREIILTVGFQPAYASGQTANDLRNQLYPFLAPKMGIPVTVSIRDAAGVEKMTTLGNIKHFEANIFAKDPEVVITITCFDAYFTGGLAFLPGVPYSSNYITVTNPGTAPTGFKFNFTYTAAAAAFEMFDGYGSSIYFNYAFLSGDIIDITTAIGSIVATVKRSGVTSNLIPYMNAKNVWLQLYAGENRLYINNKLYINAAATWTLNSLTYTTRYWGV